jgi:DNA-binding MurR/RpiR family transcriptional regulator
VKTAPELRPESLTELREMIAKRKVRLGDGLETVARFMLENPLDAAFGTCSAIASRCNVSTATVNRLASSFGFGKYAEFRELFRQPLRSGPRAAADGPVKDGADGRRRTAPSRDRGRHP